MAETDQWRVGRKVPINVYKGDRPVCQCHNEEDAQAIVLAMNARCREATPEQEDSSAIKQIESRLDAFGEWYYRVIDGASYDAEAARKDYDLLDRDMRQLIEQVRPRTTEWMG